MLCCSRCGRNLRIEDGHFQILLGVSPAEGPIEGAVPPIKDQKAIELFAEMCVGCLQYRMEPLLKRGRALVGTEYPTDPVIMV